MEWSPIHPSAWVLQWVRSCGSSTSMQDITALPAVSCPQCSSSAAIVFDRPTGRVVRFCVSCQLVAPHDGVCLPPQLPPARPPDNEPPADWFSHGPLSIFPSLYGWGRGDPTPPGSGTQSSWLFCPLISLGLALAESRLNIPPYFIGNREQVVVTPPNIMSMIDPLVSSQAPSPFTVAPFPSPPRSLFASLPLSTAPASRISDPSPVVAGPFAQHPPSVVPQVSSFSPQSEFGFPRLTRFLEMPLDRYVNVVTSMINDGRFNHIGHSVLRLEGQTAWGVWLRINHCSLSCWCPVPRGKQHFDFPWLSHNCEATFAPSFPGFDVWHFGFPPFSFSGG